MIGLSCFRSVALLAALSMLGFPDSRAADGTSHLTATYMLARMAGFPAV